MQAALLEAWMVSSRQKVPLFSARFHFSPGKFQTSEILMKPCRNRINIIKIIQAIRHPRRSAVLLYGGGVEPVAAKLSGGQLLSPVQILGLQSSLSGRIMTPGASPVRFREPCYILPGIIEWTAPSGVTFKERKDLDGNDKDTP